MNEILKRIGLYGIVPVVKIEDKNNAIPLAKAINAGGLNVAEITFRTAAAQEAIAEIAKAFPDMLVGAGTVLTIEQAEKAKAAGARFAVSPGFNRKVVQWCIKNDFPIIPGCTSPTDIEAAIELGIEVVKFFPAEPSGGLNMIKALSAPYTNIRFIPTGGVNERNMVDYLKNEKVLAVGGSWMVDEQLISEGSFEEITKLTRQAVSIMLGFDLAHIGINMSSNGEAAKTADEFSNLFGLTVNETSGSYFAGKIIEVLKSQYLGKNGHIAIKTNNVSRAINHLASKGVAFDMNTAKFKDDRIITCYMKNEIANFAIHLVEA